MKKPWFEVDRAGLLKLIEDKGPAAVAGEWPTFTVVLVLLFAACEREATRATNPVARPRRAASFAVSMQT